MNCNTGEGEAGEKVFENEVAVAEDKIACQGAGVEGEGECVAGEEA